MLAVLQSYKLPAPLWSWDRIWNLKFHLNGELHVTGDMGENGHSWQWHQDGSYTVTSNPAWNCSHQNPSATQHTAQVESHTGEGKKGNYYVLLIILKDHTSVTVLCPYRSNSLHKAHAFFPKQHCQRNTVFVYILSINVAESTWKCLAMLYLSKSSLTLTIKIGRQHL